MFLFLNDALDIGLAIIHRRISDNLHQQPGARCRGGLGTTERPRNAARANPMASHGSKQMDAAPLAKCASVQLRSCHFCR